MFNANHRGDCLRFTVLKDPCLPFFFNFCFSWHWVSKTIWTFFRNKIWCKYYCGALIIKTNLQFHRRLFFLFIISISNLFLILVINIFQLFTATLFCTFFLFLGPIIMATWPKQLFHKHLCYIFWTSQQCLLIVFSGFPIPNFIDIYLKYWRIHFNSHSAIFIWIKWQTNERIFQARFSCPILTNKQYSSTVNINSSISKSKLINKLCSFSLCL